VRATTTAGTTRLPDLLISTDGNTDIGGGIYTPPTDISQQTAGQSVAANAT
jgi:hypothetical protein